MARSRKRKGSLPPQVPLSLAEADDADADALAAAVHCHDVVLIATRPAPGLESAITTTRWPLDAAATAGVRIVFVGG